MTSLNLFEKLTCLIEPPPQRNTLIFRRDSDPQSVGVKYGPIQCTGCRQALQYM
ncbi:hypothetical protein [Phaffia rhodozyma]|uniref:Uncharacterized protein n=1 Tax=Phaffia rhodozyma TaxID=264483 RepID=A0A0F7SL23_PHARH|nr:hypothetical protein [Phaffia rhodozyma]